VDVVDANVEHRAAAQRLAHKARHVGYREPEGGVDVENVADRPLFDLLLQLEIRRVEPAPYRLAKDVQSDKHQN
jgi:hypothetical protein